MADASTAVDSASNTAKKTGNDQLAIIREAIRKADAFWGPKIDAGNAEIEFFESSDAHMGPCVFIYPKPRLMHITCTDVYLEQSKVFAHPPWSTLIEMRAQYDRPATLYFFALRTGQDDNCVYHIVSA